MKHKVTLCCRASCPSAEINTEDFSVVITDDYGGKVRMTIEELEMLAQEIEKTLVSSLKSPLGGK